MKGHARRAQLVSSYSFPMKLCHVPSRNADEYHRCTSTLPVDPLSVAAEAAETLLYTYINVIILISPVSRPPRRDASVVLKDQIVSPSVRPCLAVFVIGQWIKNISTLAARRLFVFSSFVFLNSRSHASRDGNQDRNQQLCIYGDAIDHTSVGRLVGW